MKDAGYNQDQSIEDVADFLRRAEAIADDLRETMSRMKSKGIDAITMNSKTADSHLRWIKGWSEKMELASRRAAADLEAAKRHESLARRNNKK